MNTRYLRSMLLGSAIGVGLLASGGPASALETSIGDVRIFFDTTVSVGAQVKTSPTKGAFISEANGGNQAPGIVDLNNAASSNFGVTGKVTADAPVDLSYGASINGDDGKLNFDKWDFTSANVKATHDLQASWRNFTLFARGTEFYDYVLARDDGYKRSGIDNNNIEEVGRDIRLLDLYVSGDFDVGDLPLNLRAGKQVVSWGEGTFIFNGVNVINPVDVNAFRRPGVEIKEGLLPVWALYGSIGLPFDLSLEGFYQLDWEPFQIDPGGTPFAGSDVANPNSSFGGNQGIGFYSGGAYDYATRRNCAGSGLAGLVGAGVFGATAQATYPYATCTDGSFYDFDVRYTAGQAETQKIAVNPLLGTRRGADQDPDDSGQFGLALRWYSEELNSTEFGFYYVNYHSRVPLAQVAPTPGSLAQVVMGASGNNVNSGNQSSKLLRALGCGTYLAAGSFGDTTMPANVNVAMSDPNGYLAALAPTADAILAAASHADAGTVTASVTANGANAYDAARINCALYAATADTATNVTIDGEPTIAGQQDLSLTLTYPEDIELWGMSFNTTVGDWGVQGEVTFRPNQPFQVDTDQQTISAAGSGQCASAAGYADALRGALIPLSTGVLPDGYDTTRNCNTAFYR